MHMHDGVQIIYTDTCPVCTRDEEIAELKKIQEEFYHAEA